MYEEIMDSGAGRPKRKNDPVALRARVLDTAFALFQAQGYNATGVQEIAAAAGVTGGALHHHFPSKKALGLAMIRERVAIAVEETWLEPVQSARTARDGIRDVFAALAKELDRNGTVQGCPVNNLTLELAFADPDFRAELRSIFDLWRKTLAAKIREQAPSDADRLATMVIASYSGAMAIAKVEQRGEPLRQCAKELDRLL
ncbi:MAG TPA: TetR family transcriptional regulator [Sphingomicrobium sp.]|jgi:AcrR family transcriptional regulator|nr:TetR family transcriptional regulator [Sphingomicrobium sp.]